jgi:ATP-dependent RNA helicase RhlE
VPRALVLAPTRELAVQIGESFAAYGAHLNLRHTVILGGVKQSGQARALSKGVDIIVATPGRLLDLVNQRAARLGHIQHFVLDEADRMLDMGFIRDVQKLVNMLPKQRQSLLFSATMPKDVEHLAASMLRDPVRVEVAPQSTTVERVEQRVHFVPTTEKRKMLLNLMEDRAMSRVLVFTRTKHQANKVSEYLDAAAIPADAIHGNKSQNARQKALENFRSGKARVLVATDIAARGIDVDGVTHVVNFELPNEPESYVHRIGRTARAGASGIAISLCDSSERGFLRDIERITRQKLTVVGEVPANFESAPPRQGQKQGRRPQQHAQQHKPHNGPRGGDGQRNAHGEAAPADPNAKYKKPKRRWRSSYRKDGKAA